MWDINGGGFTMEPIRKALSEMGIAAPFFGAEFTEQDRMRDLWETEGLGRNISDVGSCRFKKNSESQSDRT
jgi:hypothetical protein